MRYTKIPREMGLVLRVTTTGQKSIAFRYWYDGQSRQYTTGKYGVWDLAGARKEVKKSKKLIGKGIDPIQKKQTERQRRPMTFGEVLERYKADKMPELKLPTRVDRLRRLKVIEKGLGAKSYIEMRRGDIISCLDSIKPPQDRDLYR